RRAAGRTEAAAERTVQPKDRAAVRIAVPQLRLPLVDGVGAKVLRACWARPVEPHQWRSGEALVSLFYRAAWGRNRVAPIARPGVRSCTPGLDCIQREDRGGSCDNGWLRLSTRGSRTSSCQATAMRNHFNRSGSLVAFAANSMAMAASAR